MEYDWKDICANCGCTFGSHHGGSSPWPYNYCPGIEGGMDWNNGPGTVFKLAEDPEIEKINNMSQEEMARLWRFSSSGHKYFDKSKPYFEIFNKRFQKLGGFTPEISKKIGWGDA